MPDLPSSMPIQNFHDQGALWRRGARILLLLVAPILFSIAMSCGGGGSTPNPNATNTNATRFSAPGPFATTSIVVSNCTIFRPSTLGQEGVTYPLIIWGNGTNAQSTNYQELLSHLASHGFIVAAANTPNAGDGSQMLDALTYLMAQNTTAGSPYLNHIDVHHVGASGHSQGGAGAIMAGRDARVTVTAPLQPYILPISGGGEFLMAAIGQQQGPMFLLSGGDDSVALPNTHQRPVYEGANTSVVWGTLEGAGHYAPFGDAGGFRGPLTAWFLARLLNDPEATLLFPPSNALSATPGWSVVSK